MEAGRKRMGGIIGAFFWGIRTTRDIYEQAKLTAWKTATLIALLVVLLWLSIFMYGSFYYAYLPVAVHTRDANLQFSAGSCEGREMSNMCTFPSANISLLVDEQSQLLARGQAYQVQLVLEMPQDETNIRTGMFMVKLQLYTHYGVVISEASRAAILRYRSSLLEFLETLLFFPLLTFNYMEQQQLVPVELVSAYQEQPYKPTVGAVVTLESRQIHFYSAQLQIRARFSGVRYMLSNWPTISAIIGISISFFSLSVLVLLSWYNFLWTPAFEEDEFVNDALPVPATVGAVANVEDPVIPTEAADSRNSQAQLDSSVSTGVSDEDWEDVDQSTSQEETLLRQRPVSK